MWNRKLKLKDLLWSGKFEFKVFIVCKVFIVKVTVRGSPIFNGLWQADSIAIERFPKSGGLCQIFEAETEFVVARSKCLKLQPFIEEKFMWWVWFTQSSLHPSLLTCLVWRCETLRSSQWGSFMPDMISTVHSPPSYIWWWGWLCLVGTVKTVTLTALFQFGKAVNFGGDLFQWEPLSTV